MMASDTNMETCEADDPEPATSTGQLLNDESTVIDQKCGLNALSDSPVIDSSSKDLTESVMSEFSSKRSFKKYMRLQKRLQLKSEWKSQRKMRNKERKTRKKMNTLCLEKPKINSMSSSNQKYTVVLDFSYNDLMSSKDLMKCGNQVVRCYSANRRSTNPLQLHFCSFSGKIKDEIAKNNGHEKWDIYFHEDDYLNSFDKSKLVYLTSESRNVLENFEEDKVYIIGGLVDHNAHKGISYRKAVQQGIAHAQLPLKKHIQMKARSVLAVNHVFEIILKVANGESWSKTLLNVIPPRMLENYFSKKGLTEDALSDECTNSETEEKDTAEERMPETVDITSEPLNVNNNEEEMKNID